MQTHSEVLGVRASIYEFQGDKIQPKMPVIDLDVDWQIGQKEKQVTTRKMGGNLGIFWERES